MTNPWQQRNRGIKAARMVAALNDLLLRVSVDERHAALAISEVLAVWPQELRNKLAQTASGKPDDTVSDDTWTLIVDAYRYRARGCGQHTWPDIAERIARVFAPPPAFKACGCGKAFTRAQWGELPYLGIQQGPDFDAETRRCSCGSTISIEIAHVTVCSICKGHNCRSVNCAEEAGQRGVPREERAA